VADLGVQPRGVHVQGGVFLADPDRAARVWRAMCTLSPGAGADNDVGTHGLEMGR
jgi:hypothetical protein